MLGKIATWILVSLCSLISVADSALATDFYGISLPTDAREQARLEQKLPAVLHYYSRMSATELVNFYQQQLGQPTQQKQYQQHTLLYFQRNDEQIRLVVAEQQGWRDISLMVEKR